jgi:hypothetical protein
MNRSAPHGRPILFLMRGSFCYLHDRYQKINDTPSFFASFSAFHAGHVYILHMKPGAGRARGPGVVWGERIVGEVFDHH